MRGQQVVLLKVRGGVNIYQQVVLPLPFDIIAEAKVRKKKY